MQVASEDDFMHCINIYAPCDYNERIQFYRDLEQEFMGYSNLCIHGDFNFVFEPEDKITVNGPLV